MTETIRTSNYEATADRDVDYAVAIGQIPRITWGSVFAGLALAIVIQMSLYLLGLSIGALTVNPIVEQDPFEGLGTAFIIWDAATMLISLFIGGWVAGRLAGSPSQTDGAIHGLVVWAATILVSVLLFSTTVGSFVNGTANLLGQTGTLVGNIAPSATNAVQEVAEEVDLTLTGDALQNEVLSVVADDAGVEVEVTDDDAFTQGLTNFAIAASQDGVTDDERESLQTTLADTTTLTEDEISQAATSIENNVDQFINQAQQRATTALENAAEIISSVAGVLFASLMVGAFAAGLGGFIGAPNVAIES